MSEGLEYRVNDGVLTVALSGRVDASNAAEVEKNIADVRKAAAETAASQEKEAAAGTAQFPQGKNPGRLDLVIDAEDLEYISSAGLRILLRLRKENPNLMVVNVCPEVYEILDMTGFTEMLDVKKAYRRLSVDGCEMIGRGANGAVYRYDDETIVKVYFNPDALPEIHRERELARKALVLGINTAIPYDVVRVGESYGTVMELLAATSVSKLIKADPEHLEKPLKYFVDMLKQIHDTPVKAGDMPDMKEVALSWAAFDREHLPAELGEKLYKMVEAVPDTHTMLHGDYHTNNIMVRDDEALLIDMDTICTGHPIFELGSMYNAFVGFAAADPAETLRFLGIPGELTKVFWRRSLAMYLGTDDEAKIDEVERKAAIIGNMRLLRRTIRRNEPGREEKIAFHKAELARLLPQVDELVF